MDREKLLDISWKTILKISLTLICFYIVYSVRDILVWFVFAITISVLFNPAIDFLQRKKIPRILGVIFIYLGFFGIFSVLICLTAPLFVSEIGEFLRSFPKYFEKISPPLKGLGFEAFDNIESFLKTFSSTLEKMANNIFSVLFSVFGGLLASLFVIFTAVFLSLEEKIIDKTLSFLFPKKYENYVLNLWGKCQKKVAGWFGARIIACLFVGIVSYITFFFLNVRYSFTLALFAGVFNFVPYLGPIVTGILLFLVIFPTEFFKAIVVLIAFTLIQQIEGHVLSPVLMKKFIGLHPALVLTSLVIGGKLWGVLGAILAVPLAGVLFEFLREFLQKRKEKE